MEGIGLYDLGDGRGYLVLSSQGNNTYAVFRREGNNEYVGSFAVLADPARGIDGISETDGLEVISANLGGALRGRHLRRAGRPQHRARREYQNFKLVPWSAIAGALNLETRALEAAARGDAERQARSPRACGRCRQARQADRDRRCGASRVSASSVDIACPGAQFHIAERRRLDPERQVLGVLFVLDAVEALGRRFGLALVIRRPTQTRRNPGGTLIVTSAFVELRD